MAFDVAACTQSDPIDLFNSRSVPDHRKCLHKCEYIIGPYLLPGQAEIIPVGFAMTKNHTLRVSSQHLFKLIPIGDIKKKTKNKQIKKT